MSYLADSYGTVSDIEVGWTLIAAVGFCVSVYNFRDALADWRATASIPPLGNGRRRIALATCRVECARLIIQAIFLAIGIGAFLLPDSGNNSDLPIKYRAFGALFRWGLITASLLVMLQSIENRRTRNYVVSVIDKGGSP